MMPNISSTGSPLPPDDAADRQRLIAFSRKISDAVRPHAKRIRRLLLLHLLSACWITYYAHLFFASSFWLPAILLTVLCLPAVVLLLLYLALSSVVDLPERINSMGGSIRTVSARFRDRLGKRADQLESAKVKKPSYLFKVIRIVADVREVLFEVPGAFDLYSSVAMLANPFFLMIAGITVLISIFLTLTALLLLVIYII